MPFFWAAFSLTLIGAGAGAGVRLLRCRAVDTVWVVHEIGGI